ncbi:hypothetical protein PAB09_01130 [Corynebacterium sp. SCR221107]|uniref:hypothetical protein n=1 Tax=Corynebacterium sp. SCR221107 TaxID=3017361 RepID=UPI0022EC83AB|nr:hypothetical protein [Corynebacterium sp. SCR221107]WBT08088.1 hypothetical protein PAB09_09290 [Corynebacterium sp. SCR221107]WBT08985.1 hypothetical protein PAB09_01130 [Corynebacterium sp. SCR221107]
MTQIIEHGFMETMSQLPIDRKLNPGDSPVAHTLAKVPGINGHVPAYENLAFLAAWTLGYITAQAEHETTTTNEGEE